MPRPPDADVTGRAGAARRRETTAVWALALVFALACAGLGRWQWQRFEDKREKAQLVERNYEAAAVPLPQLMARPDAPFDPALQWRQVVVTGTYDPAGTHLVRNRPWDAGTRTATFGFEVLVPLRLADGTALLVDRGWLPDTTVPPPPGGQVRVVARLRTSEPPRDRQLPRGQLGSIAVLRVATAVGYPLYPAYGALVSESPAAAAMPRPLDPPQLDGNEGVNASYAAQWVLFALLGLAFPVWLRRRRAQLAAEDAEAAARDAVPPVREGVGTDAAQGATARDRPRAGSPRAAVGQAAPRRRRIWDTDDEDE